MRILIGLLLTSCALVAADFFPLRDGNYWTYRSAAAGETFTIRVGAAVQAGGRLHYKLSGYGDSDLLVRIDEDTGALLYWDAGRSQDVVLTSFQFESGWWKAPARVCTLEGQAQEKRGNFEGPAGAIAGVLEIQYRGGCMDAGLVQEQYAEHWGMLRRTTESIAGPRQFNLVQARVGNLALDAAPSAAFTVAVDPTVANGTVPASFVLRVNSPAALELHFTSGQEYDFALQDAGGRTLWKWSDGKGFIMSLHNRTVKGEWGETVQVPWPRGANGDLTPGTYTLKAWIAGEPAFAAAAPVTIEAPREAMRAVQPPGRPR